jgi:hypothetical protein
MKLCINCKHYLADPAFPDQGRFSRCGYEHPKSLVDGQPIPFDLLTYCSIARKYKDVCSIEAINFEEATNV